MITKLVNGIIYLDVVPRMYRFNPETEDLFFADDLEEGMLVLVEKWRDRNAESSELSTVEHELLITNRWCIIVDLRRDESNVYFIGEYDDGQRHIRTSTKTGGWYVRKDSIRYKGQTPYPEGTLLVDRMMAPTIASLSARREGKSKEGE
jgi:hypothetical protein